MLSALYYFLLQFKVGFKYVYYLCHRYISWIRRFGMPFSLQFLVVFMVLSVVSARYIILSWLLPVDSFVGSYLLWSIVHGLSYLLDSFLNSLIFFLGSRFEHWECWGPDFLHCLRLLTHVSFRLIRLNRRRKGLRPLYLGDSLRWVFSGNTLLVVSTIHPWFIIDDFSLDLWVREATSNICFCCCVILLCLSSYSLQLIIWHVSGTEQREGGC